MNSRNYPLAGTPEPDHRPVTTVYGTGYRPAPEEHTAAVTHEEQERFARNRAESLQLCNDFHAFYAAHPLYRLDL